MTKSQNTKNEQLTEQWKKGKLPSGWYYVKGSRVEGIYAYTAEYLNNMYRPENGERIIEQVPSYEEWQAKLEENAQLKERISKLEKMQYSYTPEEWNTMLRTVNRTKELLKRAKIILEDEGDYMIVQEIDEALK